MLEKYQTIDLFWWLTPPVRREYIIDASVVYIRIGPNLVGERVCPTGLPFLKRGVYRLG